MKYILFVALYFMSGFIFSQSTKDYKPESVDARSSASYIPQLVVCPYSERMYNSQIDAKLMASAKYKSIDSLRKSILEVLLHSIKKQFTDFNQKVVCISPYEEQSAAIYQKIMEWKKEAYLSLENSKIKKDSSNLKSIFKGNRTATNNQVTKERSYLSEGQLKSLKEPDQRYMGVEILQKDSLSQITDEPIFGYLFINQIDLSYALIAGGSSPENYRARIHFSYFDKDLNLKSFGIESADFKSASILNLELEAFKKISEQLMLKVMAPK